MHLRRCATAVLGLVLLSPVLVACGSDNDLKAGDRISAREDDQFIAGGISSSVVLPIGRLEVSLGKATKSLKATDTRELQAAEAPAGSVFLPITWQYDAATFGAYEDYLDTDAIPTVDLVADGATYRLPAPEAQGDGSDSFYVVVSGSGEDPQLEVEFDGVSQTVDLETGERETGRAQPLYDLKAQEERARSCTPDAEYGLAFVRQPEFTCSIGSPIRLPYAGGAWAEEGHSWLVVSIGTAMRRFDQGAANLRSGAVYVAGDVTATFRLGRIEPTAVLEDSEGTACPDKARGGCKTQYHLVFDVTDIAPRKLTVKQSYNLTVVSVYGGATAKDTLELPVTVTTRVR